MYLDASKFTVEVGENGYQLIAPGGVESGVTGYGETAGVEVEGETYETTLTDDEEVPVISMVLKGDPQVEEVEFELEEDEEEEEEEG